MTEDDFEGTLVLEKIAEIGRLDDFMAAIDADDFEKARWLMVKAGLNRETIQIVLQKMQAGDGEH